MDFLQIEEKKGKKMERGLRYTKLCLTLTNITEQHTKLKSSERDGQMYH